ncbi:hypothetical protein [Enterovibrio norvegicus]|uniref:hypothetical protein n=1 Tax=Enterovibrio norvegicus TaxID=188144 RepID=UPI000C847998|nr:hypothetical protein [Enterovibrio norvegicus]PMH65402.1 hypothetical protein BCU62_13195 [Enterovibrio norvegicus]
MLSMNNPSKNKGGARYELTSNSHNSNEFTYIQGSRRWVEFPLNGQVEIIQGYYQFSRYTVDGTSPYDQDIYAHIRYYDENGDEITDSGYAQSMIYSPDLYYTTPEFTLIAPKGAHKVRVTSINVDMKVVFKTRAFLQEVES